MRHHGGVQATLQTDRRNDHPGRGTRVFLGIAFGSLVAIVLAAGWDALSTVREMHVREESARLDFLSRTEPIVQVRSKLTVYGNLVQESVSAESVPFSQAQEAFRQVQSELDRYPPLRKPDERTLVDRLQTLLAEQDLNYSAMAGLRDPPRMKLLLNSQMLPGQQRAFATVEEIVSWNTGQLRAADSELLSGFNQLRNRMKRLLFLLMGAALAIALSGFALITAQQREIRKRYAELAKNHEAQADLSARLMNAQEQERLSISRELHDEVGQSLGAMLVDLGRLTSILPAENTDIEEALRKIRASAESSVTSVRNMALLLRPSMLDDLGLVAAIEWQAREVSRRTDVEVEVDAPELSGELREDVKVCLYRLVQEALNNVARHSGARHAWVTLHQDQREIGLTVRDDGKGFDPDRSRGLGLVGMRERLRLLHGLLRVESSPGSGTSIVASLPLT